MEGRGSSRGMGVPEERRYPWAWLALLLAVGVLRAPAVVWGPLNIDETDFIVVGATIRDGSLRHLDATKEGIPLTYLCFNLDVLATLVGDGLAEAAHIAQVLCILWVFATCRVVGHAAERWTGSARVGLVAGWAYALVTSCNVPFVATELTMNLPVAAALDAFVRARGDQNARWCLACGALLGVATLLKQQGGILMPAVGAAILWESLAAGTREARLTAWRRLAAIGAGFVAPLALAVVGYAWLVRTGVLSHEPIVHNLFGASAGSWPARLAGAVLFYVVFAAPLPWLEAIRGHGRLSDPVRRALVLCLVFTWIPVSLGGRFYGHYFLQFAPALAILAAPGISDRLNPRRTNSAWRRRLAAAVFVFPALGFLAHSTVRGLEGDYPCQEPRTVAVAQWLRENTPESARLFVWGHYTPIYYLSERLPGTRHRNASVIVGDFDPGHLPEGFDPGPHVAEEQLRSLIDDLESGRVEYVVDTAPADIHAWRHFPMDRVPDLATYVRTHYERVASPGGADVYRRRVGSRPGEPAP